MEVRCCLALIALVVFLSVCANVVFGFLRRVGVLHGEHRREENLALRAAARGDDVFSSSEHRHANPEVFLRCAHYLPHSFASVTSGFRLPSTNHGTAVL